MRGGPLRGVTLGEVFVVGVSSVGGVEWSRGGGCVVGCALCPRSMAPGEGWPLAGCDEHG